VRLKLAAWIADTNSMELSLDVYLMFTPQRGTCSRVAVMVAGQPMLVLRFDHDCDVRDQVEQAVLGLHGEPLDRELAAAWLGASDDRTIIDALTELLTAESGYDIVGERRGHLARTRTLAHAELLAWALIGEGDVRIAPAHPCNDMPVKRAQLETIEIV
jgi:hypothetical protein